MPTSTHPYVRWLADKTTDELKDLMTVRLTSLRRNGYGPISPRDLTQLATMLGDPDNVLPDVRRMATPYLHLLRVMADRGGSIPEADAVDVLRGAPEDVATMVGAAVACGYVGRADGWLHLCPGLDESIRRTTSAPPPDGVSLEGPTPPLWPVDQGAIDDAAATALRRFVIRLLAVWELIAREPVPTTTWSEVGRRQISRLARVTGSTTDEVRMALRAGLTLGVITSDPQGVAPGPRWDATLLIDPSEIVLDVICSWGLSGAHWTQERSRRWELLPSLTSTLHDCGLCCQARAELLSLLTDMSEGYATSPVFAQACAHWRSPLAHHWHGDDEVVCDLAVTSTVDPDARLEPAWQESQLLGLHALGGTSSLGRAYLGEQAGEEAMVAVLEDWLHGQSWGHRWHADPVMADPDRCPPVLARIFGTETLDTLQGPGQDSELDTADDAVEAGWGDWERREHEAALEMGEFHLHAAAEEITGRVVADDLGAWGDTPDVVRRVNTRLSDEEVQLLCTALRGPERLYHLDIRYRTDQDGITDRRVSFCIGGYCDGRMKAYDHTRDMAMYYFFSQIHAVSRVPADEYAALDERFDVDRMDVSDDDPAEEIHLASS
ncbi:hypothetical protein [Arsenicicoccus bolidensis]|uniref:hypothetical protein n=1 Tax=Arsenicicoccus bolidensis TaxID=229480 RepID=UPI0028B03CE9|nr:hypothetical protein [Arsenicicoccus bolidensis]